MLRCASARSVVRWLMKPSALGSVVKRTTPKVGLEALSTACIVANSSYSQDENDEINLLVENVAHRGRAKLSFCSVGYAS